MHALISLEWLKPMMQAQKYLVYDRREPNGELIKKMVELKFGNKPHSIYIADLLTL